MVSLDNMVCPNCGHDLKYYDSVSRILRTRGRVTDSVRIRRFRCSNCNKIHREIPDDIYPYKQYEAEIIRGVLEGYITSDTYGYEDYPCATTMNRWRTKRKQMVIPGQISLVFNAEASTEFIFLR